MLSVRSGYGASSKYNRDSGHCGYLHGVEALCTDTLVWSEVEHTSHPHSFPGAVTVENKVYVFGGLCHINGGEIGRQNYIEIYDPKTDTWADAVSAHLDWDRCCFELSCVSTVWLVRLRQGIVRSRLCIITQLCNNPVVCLCRRIAA